jgi:hypothetical protein
MIHLTKYEIEFFSFLAIGLAVCALIYRFLPCVP